MVVHMYRKPACICVGRLWLFPSMYREAISVLKLCLYVGGPVSLLKCCLCVEWPSLCVKMLSIYIQHCM